MHSTLVVHRVSCPDCHRSSGKYISEVRFWVLLRLLHDGTGPFEPIRFAAMEVLVLWRRVTDTGESLDEGKRANTVVSERS